MSQSTLRFLAAIGLWAGIAGIAWALHAILWRRRK